MSERDVGGMVLLNTIRAQEMDRLRRIEQALRAAGINAANAADYQFVEEYRPGRRNRLRGVRDRAGVWIVRFDDA